MARYFLHRQLGGEFSEDVVGRWFSDQEAACRAAFRQAATAIGRTKENLHIGIEVSDGTRTCCVVRASIVIRYKA